MRKSASSFGLTARLVKAITLLGGVAAACLPASSTQARPRCAAIAYWDADFGGERLNLTDDVPFVGKHWNDQISSIRVLAGQWAFYWDANYGGEVLRYGPGAYPFVGPHWNDQISSMRCLAPTAGTGGLPGGPGAGPGIAGPDYPTDDFVEGGTSYAWYESGWAGAGFYVVGFPSTGADSASVAVTASVGTTTIAAAIVGTAAITDMAAIADMVATAIARRSRAVRAACVPTRMMAVEGSHPHHGGGGGNPHPHRGGGGHHGGGGGGGHHGGGGGGGHYGGGGGGGHHGGGGGGHHGGGGGHHGGGHHR